MDKFSEWLGKRMREKGWSQADLARVSGLTRQTISYYLAGKSKKPDGIALRQLAKAFSLDEKDIFRAAGILSPAVDADPWVEKQAYRLSTITDPVVRKTIENIISSIADQEEKLQKAKGGRQKKVGI